MAGADLAHGPLGPHLRSLALPASVGLFFNVLFNVTDTLCAGLWSTDALAALAFSFPVFFLVLAPAVGIMQGATGTLARARGAKRLNELRLFVGQFGALGVGVGLALAVAGFIICPLFLGQLGAAGAQLDLALDYILWIYVGAPLLFLVFLMSAVLSAHGDTRTFRNALVSSAVLNLALDPLLMFGVPGVVPGLGMHGIGLATVIAYAVQAAVMLPVLLRLPGLAGLRAGYLCPRKMPLARCVRQSWPPALNMLAIGVGFSISTFFIAAIDTLAVAAYGVALRIEQLILLPMIGVNMGLLSIVGQSFGARDGLRVRQAYWLATKVSLGIAMCGALFMLTVGGPLAGLFNDDAQVRAYAEQYFIAAAILGPVYVFTHNSGSMLQAVGQPRLIGMLGLARLCILPLLLTPLFVHGLGLGVPGVWISLVLSNVLATAVLTAYSHVKVRRAVAALAVPAATPA